MAAAYRREDWDCAEIVADGPVIWWGYEHLTDRTLAGLIAYCAVSLDEDTRNSNYKRYRINSVGLLLADKPELAGEIFARMALGRSLRVTADGIEDIP